MESELILKTFENPWVQGIVNKIFTKGKEFLNDLNEKEKIQWGIAFEKYLKKTNESFSKTKTLLYRDTPVDIYDFYECISLLKAGETHIDTQEINNILNEGHKILITGLGGVGKTILMKHLFLNTIKTTNLIPVLIELRRINGKTVSDFDLKKYIIDTLKDYNLNLSEKYYDYTFDEGYYVFLFDGYDEVEDKLKITLKAEISKFSLKYNKNYFIISSRPSSEFISWENFLELKSLHLNKEQAISMIKKLKYDTKVKESFCKDLENGLLENYHTFASIPLLLIIMLLTYEATATIPNKLNEFYEQAFSVLFNKHDATKGLYTREIRSKLGYESFKKAFSYFCFRTYFESKYSFSHSEISFFITKINDKKLEIPEIKSRDFLYDLMYSVCMILEDGLEYKFIHRSFQEYFAAIYIRNLSDEKQKNFFKSYLNRGITNNDVSFYQILYELQRERFILNILEPFINEVEDNIDKKMKEMNYSKKRAFFEVQFSALEFFYNKNSKLLSFRNRMDSYYDKMNKFRFLIKNNFNVLKMFRLYKNFEKKFENNLPEILILDSTPNGNKIWEIIEENCLDDLMKDWQALKDICSQYSKKIENNKGFNSFLEDF